MVTKVRDSVGPTLLSDPFAQDTGTTTGLSFGYDAGDVLKSGTVTAISASTVTMPASSTAVVYIDYGETPPQIKAAAQGVPDKLQVLLLYLVTTNDSSITSVQDLRNWTMGRTIAA